LALRFSGKKLTSGAGKMERVLRVYDIEYKTVIVQEAVPGHWEERWVHIGPIGEGWKRVWVEGTAAITQQMPTGQRAVVFSKRGVPIREWKADSIALEWPQGLSERQFSQGWSFAEGGRETSGSDRLGDFRQIAFIYTNPKRKSFGLEDKSDSKDWLNPLNWFS
jgi:hypothetical protein